MTQTVVPAAPPDVAAPDRQPSPLQRLVEQVRHELARTPGQLRVVAGLAVLATLIVALGGGLALRERSSALDEARDAAQHLVLVQSVQTSLAQANADVTNSFLGFGLEPEGQRLDYIKQIETASSDLAKAARTNQADATKLGEIGEKLTRYTGYVASARANNRQNLPVGANYLGVADDELNLPLDAKNPEAAGMASRLDQVAASDSKRLDDALARAGNARWWLLLVAVLGVGGLVGVQAWLAGRSRRILNVPLAAATALAVLALLIGTGAMVFAQSRANDVTNGSLRDARDLSTSRVDAFKAKAAESLTLIQRGSATEKDADWEKLVASAGSALPNGNLDAAEALDQYVTKHRSLNKLDVAGNWDGAVDQATSGAKGSANAYFTSYANDTAGTLRTQGTDAVDRLDNAGTILLPVGILIVLAGLTAAVGAWWGVSLRLDEYR